MRTVHEVPWGDGGLLANCGQRIDGWNHTGRFGRPRSHDNGERACPECSLKHEGEVSA